MKKLILTSLGMTVGLLAMAQGTFNASNNYPVGGPTGPKAYVLDTDGLPLSKATGKVQILNAANQETLSPNGDAGASLLADGLFFINGIIVPGAATGSSASLIVRAWDSSSGATWALATEKISGLVTVNNLGGGTTPAATFAADSNFSGLKLVGEVIPEPSTVALATLGVLGLLFVARRKN